MPKLSSLRWKQARILPDKPQPTHINKNGLIKIWELANKRLELMGQAEFKRIQFPCNYFRYKAGRCGSRVAGMQPTAPYYRY